SDYISFEIAAFEKKISFYINCPSTLKDIIEKQIHAQYPTAQIEQIAGYNPFVQGAVQATTELILQKKYVYPFRTYKLMETDPLNAITNAMSKLDESEGAVIQLIISPAGDRWQKKPRHMALDIQQGKNPAVVEKGIIARAFHDLIFRSNAGKKNPSRSSRDLSGLDNPINLTPMQQEIVKRLEEKASRPGYKANVRIITSAKDVTSADVHMRNIIASFMQYTILPFNGFKIKKRNDNKILLDYIFRAFNDYGNKFILNTEELASIWHLPTPFTETPNIKWLLSKRAPAPVNIPTEGILLGKNIYRNVVTDIRIARDDRRRHMYMIGRTGSGKSELLKNMAIQDIKNGEGLCLIDPHGDLVEGILEHIPKERAEDVIIFEPFDTDRPVGLNILEVRSEEQKDFAVQEMISIFYKLVTDPSMLGPMFEHNMRNAMLTLMADQEHPGTIVDIPRIFTDTEFQKYKVSKVKDLVVRNFWEKEMAKTSDFHKSEMLGYLISKVGRFVENATMRNIIGQAKSGFDFRDIMDNGKILLVNLAKGKTGEINSKLLGLILVSKIQMAALSRSDIPREQDRRDFYLYVDEFQNFITDAFSSILSEARKYRLNLVIAHQYLGQLEQQAGAQGAGSKDIRDAVFGNAGTEICFRIGVEDAETMAKEFSPVFSDFDLVNIDRFSAYVKLMINGTGSKPFNMQTMPP
ncbi:MAG: type IV secretion system DNA-binding domain-containing protein, partial [Patescibacteria group bacterium]